MYLDPGTELTGVSEMTAVRDMVELEIRGGVALVTVDNPPVNALARGVRDGLFEAVTRAREDAEVEAVVIVCKGRTFIAGADIREFGRPQEGRIIFEAQDAIEQSPKAVVAAIRIQAETTNTVARGAEARDRF